MCQDRKRTARVQLVFHAAGLNLKNIRRSTLLRLGPRPSASTILCSAASCPQCKKLDNSNINAPGPVARRVASNSVHGRLHQLKQYIRRSTLLRPDTTGACPTILCSTRNKPSNAKLWNRSNIRMRLDRGPARVNQLVFHAAGSPAKKI
jgi:hypothetical protein